MADRILIADDEESSRTGLETLLSSWGYQVQAAVDGQDAVEKARSFRPAVVVADLVMPKLDGLDLLKELHQQLPEVPVIILTGHGSIDSAIAATRAGAHDYLTKPVDLDRLQLLIEKALQNRETMREVGQLRRRVKELWGVGRLIGRSTPMREVMHLIELAAPSAASVLITGETGTGKEMAARTIHELSSRARGPFVAVNCAAIPETLLESEIFGHERGAFTGALERRTGCFELADGGTLFLDEVGEMAAATQAKFLRILEEGVFRRLGGKTEIRVDIRLLTATNKEPMAAIRDKSFREDLYYRLNVFTIHLPPLRERPDDIPLLVEAFIEEFNAKYDRQIKAADEAVLKALQGHSWPGNVRELRNTIERAVVACAADLLGPGCLSPSFAQPLPPARGAGAGGLQVAIGSRLRDVERELILETLAAANNNKTRAAETLGISLKTLQNKLHRYGQAAVRPGS